MARTLRKLTLAGFALLLLAAAACEEGFVRKAARDSTADFVNDVLSTIVDETIAGD